VHREAQRLGVPPGALRMTLDPPLAVKYFDELAPHRSCPSAPAEVQVLERMVTA
jgi:hypothetical protein